MPEGKEAGNQEGSPRGLGPSKLLLVGTPGVGGPHFPGGGASFSSEETEAQGD